VSGDGAVTSAVVVSDSYDERRAALDLIQAGTSVARQRVDGVEPERPRGGGGLSVGLVLFLCVLTSIVTSLVVGSTLLAYHDRTSGDAQRERDAKQDQKMLKLEQGRIYSEWSLKIISGATNVQLPPKASEE
jgi:hypothetical protein